MTEAICLKPLDLQPEGLQAKPALRKRCAGAAENFVIAVEFPPSALAAIVELGETAQTCTMAAHRKLAIGNRA